MRVNVSGHGVINFPDDMPESDVKAFLKQFDSEKDETIPRLLTTLEKLLKQKPQIITEQKIVEVVKQVVVKVPEIKIVEVDKIVEVKSNPVNWSIDIERDEDGKLSRLMAESYE